MSDLYASIFVYFLKKHINKNNEPVYKMLQEENNKQFVFNICKTAYHLFIENKVTFSRREIQNIVNSFDEVENELSGFIEKIETDLGCYYQFVHLTIMEFCVSVYAYNYLTCKEIMVNEKLRNCLPMICGLLNKDENSFLKFLADIRISKPGDIFLKLYSNLMSRNSEKLSMIDILNLDEFGFRKLLYECFYESQSSITGEIKSLFDKRQWMISVCDGKTFYETSCENYFLNHLINSELKLPTLYVNKSILSDDEKNLIIKSSTIVRRVFFYCPIKFDGWKPKDKIQELSICILKYSISKKDFEECFLSWINVCEELYLDLHVGTDYISDIFEWIHRSNVKKFVMVEKGKNFINEPM
ncbi:uncharacterized protein LOC101240943 [Hydra vulgaris]|uniref:uncharacterized protein LOC101240943 n=1 Tax=Hydra vulgaris TaxID=6087 RepID=UPI001F5F127A|nr:uncharacterized protein LOC101240943 [Hydra vulgaris]